MSSNRINCRACVHFRSAPYGARIDGCFHSEHMGAKQKDAFLDEQQIPGNHRRINIRGDCKDFEARETKPSLLRRIFSRGA